MKYLSFLPIMFFLSLAIPKWIIPMRNEAFENLVINDPNLFSAEKKTQFNQRQANLQQLLHQPLFPIPLIQPLRFRCIPLPPIFPIRRTNHTISSSDNPISAWKVYVILIGPGVLFSAIDAGLLSFLWNSCTWKKKRKRTRSKK